MTYFICAFKGEARPFIKKRGLKHVCGLSYPLYENRDTLLILTGMGNQNASKATLELMLHRPPKTNDILVNIGVCAAPKKYGIGSVLAAKEIRYKKHILHIKTSISHPFEEVVLQSVDAVQNKPCNTAVDMEAFGIYSSAVNYIDSRHMLFIKIVSDHFEPENTDIKEMIKSIELKSDEIESVLANRMLTGHTNKF